MQEFSSADSRHDFALDGARYFIPAVDRESLKVIATFSDLPRTEQGAAMQDFLASSARAHRGPIGRFLTGQKSPRRAVESLSLAQAADLFKGWAGMGEAAEPGESSSSPDVPDSTPASSPQTSPSSTTSESAGATSDD